jgi:hypothetical protein
MYANMRPEQAKSNPRTKKKKKKKKKKKYVVGKENEMEKTARKEFLVESKVIYK